MRFNKRILTLIVPILIIFIAAQIFCEFSARTMSTQKRMDISELLLKDSFTDADYETLLMQTGLGKSAIEDLKIEGDNFPAVINEFQEQFFEEAEYGCEFVFPTTKEERLVLEDNVDRLLELPPIRDGDILITKATHTLGWRHGHAAIVTDADRGEVLESILLGYKSTIQDIDKWRNYPSLLVLRPKEKEIAKKAAEFAEDKLLGVDYGLFVGIKTKDKQNMNKIDTTHCAHLVWQAYAAAGMDIDGDGWLVTPGDIAACFDLEVVFAYGFDPKNRQ